MENGGVTDLQRQVEMDIIFTIKSLSTIKWEDIKDSGEISFISTQL